MANSTPNYNLPLLDGTETVDVVNDVNALANAVDGTVKTVSDNLNSDVSGKAPVMHAVVTNEYGQGSSSLYGHVKLSDSPNASQDAASGVAATPKSVSGKAPVMHAVVTNEYGQGSSSLYGHVKLSDSPNASQDAASGVAATPKSIADIQSFINLTKTGGGAIPADKFSTGNGSTGTLSPWMYYALNEAGTYGKLYGWIGISGATTSNTFNVNIQSGAVPFLPPTTAFSVGGCAIAYYYENDTVKKLTDCSVSVKPDGTITLSTNIGNISGVNLELFMLAVPIYFRDFGDQATPNMEYRAKAASAIL